MRRLFILTVLFLAFAGTRSLRACEQCASTYDFQAEKWCQYCRYSYCGFYACAVYSYGGGGGFDYCDSMWPNSGDDGDSCYTQEGVATHRCGPDEVVYGRRPLWAPSGEWTLVRSKVLKRNGPAAKLRHTGG